MVKNNECPNERRASNAQSLFAGAACTVEETKDIENMERKNFDDKLRTLAITM